LLQAAHSGASQAVLALVAAGAGVNAVDKKGNTALHLLAGCKFSAVTAAMNALLAAGADPSMPNAKRVLPLMVATETGNTEAIAILAAARTAPSKSAARTSTPLHVLAKSKVSTVAADIRVLVAGGADLNAVDAEGTTPLQQATLANNLEAIAALAAAGAKARLSYKSGITPLHRIARQPASPWSRTVPLLVSAGADVDALDAQGESALHAAVAADNKDIVMALVAAGANVRISLRDGSTPLHYVCKDRGPSAVVGITKLMAAGAQVNAVDEHGRTPLHVVVTLLGDTLPTIDALVDVGVNVQAADDEGWIPIVDAVSSHQTEVARRLLTAGSHVAPSMAACQLASAAGVDAAWL
ncbi:ankyrin repeat domain-containing protein, partial [archaeon]